jgi:hypothetical protein
MSITIGTRGRVATPLRPTGNIEVEGRRFEAQLAPSSNTSLDIGGEVIIVGCNSFGCLVRPVEDVLEPTALPNFGEPLAELNHVEKKPIVLQPAVEKPDPGTLESLYQLLGPHGTGLVIGSICAGLMVAILEGNLLYGFTVCIGILALAFLAFTYQYFVGV